MSIDWSSFSDGDALNEVIETLRKAEFQQAAQQLESILQLIMETCLDQEGNLIGMDTLSPEMANQLGQLLQSLVALGILDSLPQDAGIAEELMRVLFRTLGDVAKKKKQEKEKEEEEEIDREQEEELMRELIYEIYKVTNPYRIAGETREENYANNREMKGKGFADQIAQQEAEKSSFVDLVNNQPREGFTGPSRKMP